MLTPSVRASSPRAASTGVRVKRRSTQPLMRDSRPWQEAHFSTLAMGRTTAYWDFSPPGSETTRGWANDAISPQGMLPMSRRSVE